jgi:hypothetical protein
LCPHWQPYFPSPYLEKVNFAPEHLVNSNQIPLEWPF